MTFYDRQNEVRTIRDAVSRPHCFVVLTGRRRIGKTRLVREALKDTDHIELFIPRKRLPLVIESLKDSIREQTGFSPDFKGMGDIFEYLLRKEKKVLFIDEISNLSKVEPGAFSDLQRILDAHKEDANIRLIVDGSYIGVMKRIFQDRKEPLFGRATELIELGPLPLKDSIAMTKGLGFSFKDALEACSIMGGVPRYLELLEGFDGMADLKRRMFSQGSIFLPEGENLLVQEFGASWDTYFSILEVIARGRAGPTSLANELGMSVQMVPKYLMTLRKLKLIGREGSVFGKKNQVRYRILDPFLQFWFRVCYPRMDQLKDGISDVPPELMDEAVGRSMERLVRNAMQAQDAFPFKVDGIGSWWNRSGDEIDIVAFSKKGKDIAFGEVKWTNRPVGPDLVASLLDKKDRVDWNKGARTEHPFIVSRSDFSRKTLTMMEAEGVVGFGLGDLQGLIMDNMKLKWKKADV